MCCSRSRCEQRFSAFFLLRISKIPTDLLHLQSIFYARTSEFKLEILVCALNAPSFNEYTRKKRNKYGNAKKICAMYKFVRDGKKDSRQTSVNYI